MIMNCLTPLTVCGAPTSGKSVLAALLDGTSAVSCTLPLICHDNFSAVFPLLQPYLDDASSRVHLKWGQDKLLYFLRKLLIDHSAYYISLPPVFDTQRMNFFFSSSQVIALDVPAKIPFFALDSLILSRIQDLESASSQNIFSVINQTILENIQSEHDINAKYHLSVMCNEFSNYDQVLSSYNNSKIVYIDRDLHEAVGSSFLREACTLRTPFQNVLARMDSETTRAWIRQIHNSRCTLFNLQSTFPHKVCIINFKELMTNTRAVMQRLASFLDIPFDERYLQPSFMGIPMEIDDFFTIRDDMQRLLSAADESALRHFINAALADESCKSRSPFARIAAFWRSRHAERH